MPHTQIQQGSHGLSLNWTPSVGPQAGPHQCSSGLGPGGHLPPPEPQGRGKGTGHPGVRLVWKRARQQVGSGSACYALGFPGGTYFPEVAVCPSPCLSTPRHHIYLCGECSLLNGPFCSLLSLFFLSLLLPAFVRQCNATGGCQSTQQAITHIPLLLEFCSCCRYIKGRSEAAAADSDRHQHSMSANESCDVGTTF